MKLIYQVLVSLHSRLSVRIKCVGLFSSDAPGAPAAEHPSLLVTPEAINDLFY